jgi:chromate transporter
MIILWELFLCYAQIAALCFGGGGAAMPLIQSGVVEVRGWLTMAEYTDLLAIAEMTPGPILLNSATFVGMKMAGFIGAVATTLGAVTPSIVIVLALGFFYKRVSETDAFKNVMSGLKPVVAALITAAGLSVAWLAVYADTGINNLNAALLVICFAVLRKFKPNPILVLFGAGAAGALIYWIF